MVCQIDTGIAKLVAAAAKVDQHNRELIAEQRAKERARGWQIPALAALVVFLIGGLCGIAVEKRQTADALANIGSQIERVQTPVLPNVQISRKNGKGL